MSNLSDLLPAGAGGKQVDFVASGTLSSGQTVALKSDGTVSAVSATGTTVTSGFVGSPSTVQALTSGAEPAIVFDTDTNQVVIMYVDDDNSGYLTGVVGTVSTDGTSSFGTPVVLSTAVTDFYKNALYHPVSKVVVMTYKNVSSGAVEGVAASIGNKTLTFYSPIVIRSPAVGPGIGYNVNDNVILISYYYNATDSYVRTYTVGATGIWGYTGQATIGSGIELESYSIGYDSISQNCLLLAQNQSGASRVYAFGVDTSSGVTVGAGVDLGTSTGSGVPMFVAEDTTQNKVVCCYVSPTTSNGKVYARVLSLSGTTVTAYTATQVYTPSVRDRGEGGYSSTGSRFVYVGMNYDISTADLLAIELTVSGTSIVVGDAYISQTNGMFSPTTALDNANSRFITAFESRAAATDRDLLTQPYNVSGGITNNTSFIGITDAAISSAASGSVTIKGGISSNVTGLTANATYYVQDDGSISSPTVSAPYVIVGATYVQNFSVAAQETSPRAMAFNTDGTKMFVIGDIGDDVNEYALSTGFDVSTASYTQAFSIAAQETAPSGIAFNTDGTKMFVVGTTGDAVNEYALSTGFNVSTASFTDSFSVAPQEIKPQDVAFNTDGTKMFVVGDTGDDVNEYTLATGFDVSTSSFVDSFSVSAQEAAPQGVAFNPDGTKMFVVGNAAGEVHQYTLTTGFDVSTASYASINFSAAAQDTFPMGIAFNTDGTKMFIVGLENDAVYQYSTGVDSVTTTVLAGRALSSTSINLDYTT